MGAEFMSGFVIGCALTYVVVKAAFLWAMAHDAEWLRRDVAAWKRAGR